MSKLALLLLALALLLPAPLPAHILPASSHPAGGPSSSRERTSSGKSSPHPVPASNSSSSNLPPVPLSFPPANCTEDLDCIGRNASSRVFYDPYARCDRVRAVCTCTTGFKQLPLRVKHTRGRRSSHAGVPGITPTLNLSTPLYIAKCVPETGQAELEHFLRNPAHYYGKSCTEDRDCESNLICRQLNPSAARSRNLIPAANLTNRSPLPTLWSNQTKRCRCPNGQHWNKHNPARRCEWPNSGSYGSGGDGDPSRPNGSSTNHLISQSNLDFKMFEIVLQFAFLIACLLGYKACSSVCCKSDSTEGAGAGSYGSTESYLGTSGGGKDPSSPGSDGPSSTTTCDAHAEVKSDEESIISRRYSNPTLRGARKIIGPARPGSGSLKFKTTTKSAASGRVTSGRKSRRTVGRFCRRSVGRPTSPYFGYGSKSGSSDVGTSLLFNSTTNFRRLSSVSASMSRSSSASTRNLLVKINGTSDDGKRHSVSTTLAPPNASPCWNCRIYKEVYSPSARCKSCRSSLLSVEATDVSTIDLAGSVGGGGGSKTSSLLEFDALMVLGGGDGGGGGSTVVSPISCEGKKSLLPLPPYKKPIRRSEEVGVPPHLRAPYRDSQPFWLK